MNAAVLKALREDLAASNQFLEEGNYQRILVQANRTVTESTLFADQPVLAVVGLVFRLAALELQPFGGSGQILAYPQKQAFASLLGALETFTVETALDPIVPWKILEKFHRAYWADLRPQLEGKAYSDNPEFVDKVLSWATGTLGESWVLITEPSGQPLAGIANELDRVIKPHGATAQQLARFGIFQTLAWYTDYARWQSRTQDEAINPDKLRQLMEPLINRATAILRNASDNTTFFAQVADFALLILRSWRSDFAKYYDLYLRQQRERERVGIQLLSTPAKGEPTEPAARRKKKG